MVPAAQVELCRQLTLFRRNALQRLQHQAGRQRQVKEDVRQQNARQTVGREVVINPCQLAQLRQPADTTIDGEQTKYRHQHRQHQGHGAQTQQQLTARETASIERARQRHRRQQRQQRGEQRLTKREGDNVMQVIILQHAAPVILWRGAPECTEGQQRHAD